MITVIIHCHGSKAKKRRVSQKKIGNMLVPGSAGARIVVKERWMLADYLMA